MTTSGTRRTHEQWLLEITALPTAAGREDRVAAWIERWAGRRRNLAVERDRAGNLILTQRRAGDADPLFLTAHLDHPAFVVREIVDSRTVELEFRGGVQDPYFDGARVEIFEQDDRAHRGVLAELDLAAKPFKRARARLSRAATALAPGDVGRWALPAPRIRDGRLHAPACDDLAAVAAAISAIDVVRTRRGLGHVGVLFTRAEEVGFIGAIGACRHRSVPRRARLVCLENSRSFPESPIGGGPIVRVGDKRSVFEPTLTNEISALAEHHATRDPSFRWQRKLMTGGTCEATVFSDAGYRATCICLPLGNYHNMRDIDGVRGGRRPARVGPEIISVDDYHGMIDLLVLTAAALDGGKVAPLRTTLDTLWRDHRFVLEG